MADIGNTGKFTSGVKSLLKRMNLFIIPKDKRVPSLLKVSESALLPADSFRGSIVLFSHPLADTDLEQIISYISGQGIGVQQIVYGNESGLEKELDIPLDKTGKLILKKKRLRELKGWLADGGALLLVPPVPLASSIWRRFDSKGEKWLAVAERLIIMAQAPLYLVYCLSFSRQKRLAILKNNTEMPALLFKTGAQISSKKLLNYSKRGDLSHYLRLAFLVMEHQLDYQAPRPEILEWQDIAEAIDSKLIAVEMERLPTHQKLVENGDFICYFAHAEEIPHTIQEIGRLREIHFREVGEGTGKPRDLDLYDEIYEHLILWHKKDEVIAGAYRLGKTDEILRHYGRNGLYTHSLFRYKKKFFKHFGNSLELGRSFIVKAYQRQYISLLMLWKGIMSYLWLHPQYRFLLGPVSISSDYQPISRFLIVKYIKSNHYNGEFAKMLRPLNPFQEKKEYRPFHAPLRVIREESDLASILSEAESRESRLPILLKHYLRLGGKVLAFNIDPLFNDALDGLIYLDLLQVPREQMERLLAKEKLADYLNYHTNMPKKIKKNPFKKWRKQLVPGK
jgi:putative hemolysin